MPKTRTKRKLTKGKVKEALLKHGGIPARAAEALGTKRQNINYYINKYSDVAEVRVESREKTIDVAESALMDAVYRKERWAVELILKTLGKSRGYDEKANDNNPPDITLNVQFSDDPSEVS